MRPLGSTEIRVSEVGVGTASLGNLYRVINDADARSVIETSFDHGLTYIDTAPLYGFGLSERRVGDALRGRGDCRVSTKVGRLLTPDPSITSHDERLGFHSPMPFVPVFDYSYDAIFRSWEASLQRLGLAKIDVLYVHDIGVQTHGSRQPQMVEQLTSGGGFRALEELRAEGLIGAFGIGVNETAVCRDVMEYVRIDAILLANRYTLLEPHGLDELAPICAAQGVSIVVGAPFNSGILATGTRTAGPSHYNYRPAPQDIVERVVRLEAVCERHGVALAAAALKFPLAHPQVASVIPGIGSAHEAEAIAHYCRASIPAGFWRELQSEHLLPKDAHIPKESNP
jgi:D-threo-aldose 1-dehydrogenase